MIADLVHHDEHSNYIGEMHAGLFGQKKHFNADHGYIGETWDGFTGHTTDLTDAADFGSDLDSDDSFDRDEW